MAQSQPHDRLLEIDSLRGIAAMIIVLTHYQPFFWQRVAHWGFLAVDMFFILSGFILTRTYEQGIISGSISARDFVFKRFARLAPLHYFTLAAIGILELLSYFSGHGHVFNWYMPFYSFFLNLAFLQNVGLTNEMTWNGVSWSISTEMIINILWFYALLHIKPTRAFFATVVVCAALFIFSTMGANLDFSFANKYGINIGLVRCAMGFALGAILARTASAEQYQGSRIFNNIFLFLTISLLVLCGYEYHMPGMDGADFVVVLFAYPALVYLSLGNRSILTRILHCRVLVYLGAISYSTYLVHPLVAIALVRVAPGLHAPYQGIVGVSLVIIIASATYFLIEQPSRRGLNKWYAGRKESRKIQTIES